LKTIISKISLLYFSFLICLILQVNNIFNDQEVFGRDNDDEDSKDNDDEDGTDNTSNTKKNMPTAKFDSKFDKFGIEKIYPTKNNGEEWFMNMNNIYADKQFYPFGESDSKYSNSNLFITKNNDLSWKIKSKNNLAKVRMNVYTSDGYHPEDIKTLDQSELEDQGYMQSKKDWKNVEMTGYFKINSFTKSEKNGAAHIELVARGGKNTNDITTINGLSKQCESTTYHSNTYETGRVKFEKDLEHTQGYTTEDKQRPN